MRSRLLALFTVLFAAVVIIPSGSADANTEDEVYYCYGDRITLTYEGEATDISWDLSAQENLIRSENGKTFTFDASKYDELKVTQKVKTDQGTTVKDVKIYPLHLNDLNVSVNFINGLEIHDRKPISSTTVCKNQNFIELPENPVKEGAKFGGWVYENGEAFRPTAPITEELNLKAKWLEARPVVLMSDNKVYLSLTAYDGDVISLPNLESTPERKFKGWSTERDSFVEYDQTQSVTANLTLYANWAGVCHITLISEGYVHASMTAEEGKTISLTQPVSDSGKTFDHWSTVKNGIEEYDQSQPVTGDMVLYAVWSEDEDTAAHTDLTSIAILLPVVVILSILIFSRVHRNKVRIAPGSSKGRFGRK